MSPRAGAPRRKVGIRASAHTGRSLESDSVRAAVRRGPPVDRALALSLLQVEHYNHHTASWHPAAGMLNKRCRHGAASLGSKMFVCGGYDGSGFLSIAEMYSSVADQWCLIVPMHTRRSRVSLVASCGRLYAVGGYDGQSNLSSVEMYDPETDRWTFMAPMACHEGGVGVGCIPLLTI